MPKKLESAFSTRQYMLSKDYELYYYNDTSLHQVRPHTHDYYEFYFYLEGNVVLHVEDQTHRLRAGDVVLVPPGVSHNVTVEDSRTPYRRFVFWVSQDCLNRLLSEGTEYGYLCQNAITGKEYVYHHDIVTSNAIQSKVYRLLSEINSDRFGKSAQIDVCIRDLLLLLNRRVYEEKHPINVQETAGLYQSLLLYIDEHLDEDLSLERLAREFYVSKYHISHVFKEHTGLSLHQYIMKKRLALCKDGILSNAGITDVFRQFGFHDYTSFYRAFRKEYGMSPSEYREMHIRPEEVRVQGTETDKIGADKTGAGKIGAGKIGAQEGA